MTTRRKVIRVLVTLAFLCLPQALIWLHNNDQAFLVTVLCMIYTAILSFAFLQIFGMIYLYTPEGIVIAGKYRKKQNFLVTLLAVSHILYALYVVGWVYVAITMLSLMVLFQFVFLLGKFRVARMDQPTQKMHWDFIQEQIREAKQRRAARDGKGE